MSNRSNCKNKPNAILLTRNSPFQIYCANSLFYNGIIDSVFVEEGESIQKEREVMYLFEHPLKFWRKVVKTASLFNYNLLKVIDYYYTYVITYSLTSDRDVHNRRILKSGYLEFDKNLKVIKGKSVNTKDCIDILMKNNIEIAFVFGTGLLKKDILGLRNKVFINMHWGWSPNYRSEGIISALALEGEKGLGVTIHYCNLGTDSGDIIFRERPTLDSRDNVYSIGLKLTVLGTELFIKAYNNYLLGQLESIKQDLTAGINYSSLYMKQNYWIRLRAKKVLQQIGKVRF